MYRNFLELEWKNTQEIDVIFPWGVRKIIKRGRPLFFTLSLTVLFEILKNYM